MGHECVKARRLADTHWLNDLNVLDWLILEHRTNSNTTPAGSISRCPSPPLMHLRRRFASGRIATADLYEIDLGRSYWYILQSFVTSFCFRAPPLILWLCLFHPPLLRVERDPSACWRPGWMVHPSNFSKSLHCPNEFLGAAAVRTSVVLGRLKKDPGNIWEDWMADIGFICRTLIYFGGSHIRLWCFNQPSDAIHCLFIVFSVECLEKMIDVDSLEGCGCSSKGGLSQLPRAEGGLSGWTDYLHGLHWHVSRWLWRPGEDEVFSLGKLLGLAWVGFGFADFRGMMAWVLFGWRHAHQPNPI